MKNRIEITAAEFCSSVRDGTHDSPKKVLDGGKPLVTTKHLKNGSLDISSTYNISNEDFEKVNLRSKVDKWDVLISMIGTVGEVFLVSDEPNYAIKNLGLFKVGNELNSKWLFYYLKSQHGQNQIKLSLQGSTQQYISLKSLRNLLIYIPETEKETKSIVSFLSLLDKKIELNQKMNETLEEIAKMLFKSWFIDFDPVRAKAEKKPTGLSKEISDLFPDSFEDSELDKIPKGWNVGKISENFETILGGTPARKNKNYWQGNLGWINSGKLNDFPLNIASEFINEEAVQGSSTKLANRKSTLIGLVTEMKKDLITFLDEDLYINQSIVAIQPNKNIFPEYVYLYLKANSIRLYSEQSGGAQQHINKGTVNNFKILLPDEKCLSKVNYYFESIFTKICSNARENIVLNNLRDALLPKLVSGQMKLSDAKSLTKEAEI